MLTWMAHRESLAVERRHLLDRYFDTIVTAGREIIHVYEKRFFQAARYGAVDSSRNL